MEQRQPVPIARWDAARDAWEKILPDDMFPIFEHSDVWSETWPTSGMWDGSTVYELPTSALHTNDSATSLMLPTPRATDGTKGGPNQRGSSGDLMLPSAVHRLSS